MAVTAQPFVWGAGGAQMTPERIAAERRVAQEMMMRGMDYSPIRSPWQGAARVAEAMMGGLDSRRLDEAEKANIAADREMLSGLFPQTAAAPVAATAPASPPMSPTAPPAVKPYDDTVPIGSTQPVDGDRNAAAIASIESGGKYDILGPVTKTGDRAYGKYQVMGANVPVWTKQYLGQEMTPDQFLRSPEAQDAVFKGEFGRLAQKHGPEGAARAWFAGEGGMNNPNAKDQLGTTVSAYADKFNRALGPQVASLDPTSGIQSSPGVRAVSDAMVPVGTTQVQAGVAPAPAAVAQVAAAAPQTGVNPKLLAAIASPYASEGTKKIAGLILSQQMKETGTTDELKEYNFHSQQERAAGRQPASFTDWKVGIKKAGAIQNSVQIDQRGESEFSKEAGKLQAKRFNELADDAPAAKQMLSDVEMLRDLGAKIETGKGAEVRAVVGPFAQSLGIDVKGLDEIQAYEAIVNRVAPNLRVKGSGAQSDFELKNFLKSIPSIGNTPGGNEMSSKVLEGLYQNKLSAAEIGAKALNGEITRPEAEKMLRNLPDPMKEWRDFSKAAKAGANDGWQVLPGGVRIREKK